MKKVVKTGSSQKPLSPTRYPIPKPLIVLAYFLLVIIFLTFSSIIFSSQSNWCGACHATKKEVDAWKQSSHAKLDCLSCHRETGLLSIANLQIRGLKHLIAWLFNSYPRPVSTDVQSDFCLHCHPTTLEKVVEGTSIRISHAEFTPEPYACTACHSNVGHDIKERRQNQPNMDRCFLCHNGKKASAKCDLCHTKELPDKVIASSKSPYLIIHGNEGKKTHGMGDTRTCFICHKKDFCRHCHQVELPHTSDIGAAHGQQAKGDAEPCWVCHQKSYCNGCHGLEMPHPPSFLSEHAKITREKGEKFCERCHVNYTCNYCHRRAVHPAPVQSHRPKLMDG